MTDPEWLAVGAEVEVVRSHGRSVVHRHRSTVARHTKSLVVLEDGDRFRCLPSGDYELTPWYLDYRTRLEPGGGSKGHD